MTSPLLCPHCRGTGCLTVEVGGYVSEEECDGCLGGHLACCEPGCLCSATHVLKERDQIYELCERHYLVWQRELTA